MTTDMDGSAGKGAGAAEERRAWFGRSAFLPAGVPTVWFHGTDAEEDFNVFTRWDESSIGFHFGSAPTAFGRLTSILSVDEMDIREGLRVLPVYCRAERPLRLRDHHTWRLDRVADELYDLGLASEAVVEEIAAGCDEYLLFAAIEAAGHDCVIYANETESAGRRDDSLIVWRPELIKGIHAAGFDRDDPRILPQRPVATDDLEAWRDNARCLVKAAERIAALAEHAPALPSPG